ncbi:arf-GAP with Rho-GAP domain, ANK repeat and PH domain-containing protein 1-like isoform X2 [Haliotis cracherodii]|uniref:arf-GAP with Rho-GAP domain, ANK repeat and PH domain-containing protein 1-like isoform X2 n=1 Tax=Haliotis cracherodii TaxID=6455 RepID=UPI0039EB1E8D
MTDKSKHPGGGASRGAHGGDSVFDGPPALPPKLSSGSFRQSEELLGGPSPTNKPVPKPRRNVSKTALSPTTSDPTARPIPKPRPRTMSKEKILSDLPDHPKGRTGSLDESLLPPDAEEAARMVEDMVQAEMDAQKPIDKNPIYDFEEFVGNRPEKQVLGQSVLKPEVVSNAETTAASSGGPAPQPCPAAVTEDLYYNVGSDMFGLRRSDPDGATEPTNISDGQHQKVQSEAAVLNKYGTVTDDQLFGWRQHAMQGPSREVDTFSATRGAAKMPEAVGGDLYTNLESAQTGDLMANADGEEDESVYEPVWMGGAKSKPPLPPPALPAEKRPLDNPKDTFLLKFIPGKTTDVSATSESSTDDLMAKLNIKDRWGEYASLDPRASIVYEQPPPLHPPPPLPADTRIISSAPPVPPRPNDRSSDDKANAPPTPSAVFANLETPKTVPLEDDPFKYSDFANECYEFNKVGTKTEGGWPSASAQSVQSEDMYEPFPESQQDSFDPFGLGLQSNQPLSSSQWAAAATAPAAAAAVAAVRSESPSRISLSQVPPPPFKDDMYTKVNKRAVPPENLYSVAQDMEQSLDSSDSSDEPFSTDTLGRTRTSGSSGLSMQSGTSSSASVPIISGQSSRKTERFGYLYKQGGVKANRGWRRRWVVFNGRDLRYYVNNRSQISRRVIPLACMKKVDTDVKDGDRTRFKFRLTTTLNDRVFLFAAEGLEDCLNWAQTLMAAISLHERNNNHMDNSDEPWMEDPDKEGYIKFENGPGGKKYYVSIRGSILCYYNNIEDYRMFSPIHEIKMELASVKDLSKCRLQLSTHYACFVLGFESAVEAQVWKMAIEDAIAQGLADDSVLLKVYENDSNRICADCEDDNPHWASINLGVVVCKKCAGIHRMFEANVSKIRSLRMDTRVWTPSLIELMKAIGNDNSNVFWEFDLSPEEKIDPESSMDERKQFITTKYKDKAYCRRHPSSADTRLLNEELLRVSATDELMNLVKIVFSGADIHYRKVGGEAQTAYQIAKSSGQRLLMEFLFQNGGDASSSDMGENNEGRLREDVRHQGYLFKTGPSHKSFDKRWCVLEHGSLTYYQTDKSTTAKDSIDRQCIQCIQETSVEKQQYAFDISTNKASNRVYLFAAENAGERNMWMQSLSKLICPVSIMEHVGMMEFSLAGNYYVKDNFSEDWRKSWLMLSWRLLYYMDQNQKLETVDLRKASSIKYQEIERGCRECTETGQHFVINAPNRALYIQADLVRDTERVFAACEQAIKESGRTLQDQQLTSDNVPVIVNKCIDYITMTGLKSTGIYRESATNSRIQLLLDELKKDARGVKMEDFTCNEVANALKRFFRGLDDSLFTSDSYSIWKDIAAVRDQSHKLGLYRFHLEKLPMINYNTLKKLVMHLHRVSQFNSENRMSQENLATCFAPSLMRTDNMECVTGMGSALALEMGVLTDIIKNHEFLLKVQEQERQKDDRMAMAENEIREKLKKQRMSAVIDSIIVSVYVHNTEETFKVSSCDDVQSLIADVKSKKNMNGQFMMSEMILEGSLERPLPLSELVLPVVTTWGTLEEDIRTNAKICMKNLETLQKLQSALDPSRALIGEVKFSEKKKFSKFFFQLKQGKLVCFKDSRGTHQLHSWNVEDMVIYLGIDSRRSGGKSSHGLTFIVKGEKCVRGYFGRSLCFTSEIEMLKWASVLLVAKHPEGILASFS